MRFDKQNTFSDQQAITVTANSTNIIDRKGTATAAGLYGPFETDSLGNTVGEDPGKSGVEVGVFVTEQFTAAGAATLTVSVVADGDDTLGSPTTLVSSAAIGKADLKPGKLIRLSVPPGAVAADRYLGVVYTVATGPMTAGKVVAGIMTRDGIQTAPGTIS